MTAEVLPFPITPEMLYPARRKRLIERLDDATYCWQVAALARVPFVLKRTALERERNAFELGLDAGRAGYGRR